MQNAMLPPPGMMQSSERLPSVPAQCSTTLEGRTWSSTYTAAMPAPPRKDQPVAHMLQQYLVEAPMEHVEVDVLRSFPTTDPGNRYVLVSMDYFTMGGLHQQGLILKQD
ncbi:hypothetical protein SKAU_G00280640 [Synaphobranchus kaupii]|uniref:Uncharacterized protein n=1 Tax=Synaphobranchus kaupii TaxID=118154 RepID=A0A9Q1EX51_SYNKA|nr:hypothetical protein SKAU_G00280640 [Synaphobranchus kaupii]